MGSNTPNFSRGPPKDNGKSIKIKAAIIQSYISFPGWWLNPGIRLIKVCGATSSEGKSQWQGLCVSLFSSYKPIILYHSYDAKKDCMTCLRKWNKCFCEQSEHPLKLLVFPLIKSEKIRYHRDAFELHVLQSHVPLRYILHEPNWVFVAEVMTQYHS